LCVSQQWVNKSDHIGDEISPPVWRRCEVGHPLHHRRVGLLAIRHTRKGLGQQHDGLLAMPSHVADVPEKLGGLEVVATAGHPEIGKVSIPGAGLATLHGGDDLLGEVERQRIRPKPQTSSVDDRCEFD
jgi:hypothetical protein